MINVVCVECQNYCGRGKEYVNNLFDMIRRNTTKECRYICYTDNPEGLDPYIEARQLPGFLMGWWNKLYLFKELDNARFFDLDTLVIGNIDHLLEYDGDFMLLRDFYRPDGLGSGLMFWNKKQDIWDEYERQNFPQPNGGDQAFIEAVLKKPDLFQDKYPSEIASFKVNQEKLSDKNKIMCFHGKPRPHEVLDTWVGAVWKKGGAQDLSGKYAKAMNMSIESALRQMAENCAIDVPWLQQEQENKKTLCIVGGAPSLKENLGELKKKIRLGAKVMSLNGATKFLISMGIKPDYHVQFDGRPENIDFIGDFDCECLIGSMSHPDVFNKSQEMNNTTVMWHASLGGAEQGQVDILEEYPKVGILIPGGGTVGLRAPWIGYIKGFRKFAIFGMDSSYHEDEHHAYDQALNDKEDVQDVWMDGKKYRCARWMYRQADEYKFFQWELYKRGCWIDVFGKGLLPDLAKEINRQIMEQENAANVQYG